MELPEVQGFRYIEELSAQISAGLSGAACVPLQVYVRFETAHVNGQPVTEVHVFNHSGQEIKLMLDRLTSAPNDLEIMVPHGVEIVYRFDCITRVGVMVRCGNWRAQTGRA